MKKLPLLVLALMACSEPAPPALPAYPEAEPWPETTLELGEELGRIQGDEIYRVSTVLVGDDGTMVLVQRSEQALRFYGPGGEPLGAVGREGEGPGEFLNMGDVGWLADTVWAYDRRQDRITLFGPQREFERVKRIGRARWTGVGGYGFEHLYPGDTLLVWTGNAEFGSTERTYALMTMDGDYVRDVISYPEGHNTFTYGGLGTRFRGQVVAPFAAQPDADVSADGSRIAVAEPLMDEPNPGRVAVTVVDPGGDTVFARATLTDPEPVDREVQERLLQGYTRRSPEVAAEVRAAGLPDYYPPFEFVTVGRDGSVWLEVRGTDEEKPYRVWSPEGEPVGTLTIPRAHRILEAELGEVWILEEDELDVESIAHYRIG